MQPNKEQKAGFADDSDLQPIDLRPAPIMPNPVLPAVFTEMGERGMAEFKKSVKFGDYVCNHWAGESNPQRIGIFIGYATKQNTKCVELTDEDCKKRWYPVFDKRAKLEIIGSFRDDR